jgi:N-acyl-D-aspartate/D-glutamate deacylase
VEEARRSPGAWYQPEQLRFDVVTALEYVDLTARAIADAARERAVDPFDLMFDVALADNLQTVFRLPKRGDDADSWQRRLALWRDPRTLVGGSDAGAHLDMMDTFGFYSDFVGPTVRDRQLLPLEEAVKMITYDAAKAFGLRDRGRLVPGCAADVVVLDEHEVGSTPIEIRHDLPAGGMRLYSEGIGFDVVLVNGGIVAESGRLTGELPGNILRSGQDTDTVTMARAVVGPTGAR